MKDLWKENDNKQTNKKTHRRRTSQVFSLEELVLNDHTIKKNTETMKYLLEIDTFLHKTKK